MNRLPALMASYGSYHRDPRNRATHFVGVPMIVFALMVGLTLVRIPGDGGWPMVAIAVPSFGAIA